MVRVQDSRKISHFEKASTRRCERMARGIETGAFAKI